MGDSFLITTRRTNADRLNPGGTPLRLKAAVLDQTDTAMDFGSFTPIRIFIEAFAEFGIAITLDEARDPIGLGKWDHTRTLCNDGAIIACFSLVHDHMPTDDNVTATYNRFMPLQIGKVGAHFAMIPGALNTVAALREVGLKIGMCSGYPHVVMDHVTDLAAKADYTPDCTVACGEVPHARPWPAQALRYVADLVIGDVAAHVKVDGAVPGVEEDCRVGMWTVTLLMSGNALGLPYGQYTALSTGGRARHRVTISAGFAACRPHYKIDTIADLPEIMADINHRLAHGERLQCI